MNQIYATFWLRVAAFLIDGVILALFFYVMRDVIVDEKGFSWVDLVQLIIAWLYYSLFHSSSWQGTLGKKFVGIQVVDYKGNRISFKRASLRFIGTIISETLLMLPYLTVIFTKKKQGLHDMLAKTVVVDTASSIRQTLHNVEQQDIKDNPKKTKTTLNRKLSYIFTAVLIAGSLFFLYPAIMMTAVYSYLYSHKKAEYDKSFHTVYLEKDFNDSRIDYYKEELEKSSKGFVNAEGMVDIFKYDVQQDIALDCIQYYIRDHNESDWIEERSKIRKNARNKFTNNEDLVDRAKDNEDHMGKNFYVYDLNLVNHTIEDLTNSWNRNKHPSYCDQNLSVAEIYKIFKVDYLMEYIDDHESSKKNPPITGEKVKQQIIAREKKWLEQFTQKSYDDILKWLTQKKKEKAIARMFRHSKGLDYLPSNFFKTYGFDVNIRDKEGRTPLFYTVLNNKSKLTAFYLSKGADTSLQDSYGKTVFDYFDDNTTYEVRNAFWLAKYKLKYPRFTEKKRGMIFAGKKLFVVSSYRNKESWTPLMHAVFEDDVKKVKELLKDGVNINMYNNNKSTALHFAVFKNNIEIMQILLKAGADPEARNRYGLTPIFTVVHTGNRKALKLLLSYGADINVESDYGETPLSIAYDENYQKSIDLFEAHGAILQTKKE